MGPWECGRPGWAAGWGLRSPGPWELSPDPSSLAVTGVPCAGLRAGELGGALSLRHSGVGSYPGPLPSVGGGQLALHFLKRGTPHCTKRWAWCLAQQRPESVQVAVSTNPSTCARPCTSLLVPRRCLGLLSVAQRVGLPGSFRPLLLSLRVSVSPLPPNPAALWREAASCPGASLLCPRGSGGAWQGEAEHSLCPQMSLMANCQAPRRPWLASHMSTVFVSLLCFPSFLGAAVFLCSAIWQ